MTTALATLGDALLEAHATQQPIAPLTEQNPELSVEDAYAIQLHQVAAWKAAGRIVAGYKVGLTSQAMQTQLGVDQPDFGWLFTDMILDVSNPISLDGYIQPRIEPEFSFVLKEDLRGPGLTAQDVAVAVDYAVISLELIDSRIANWKIKLADTIADNASSGALALGDRMIRLDEVDLSTVPVTLTRNGNIVGEGVGSAVLGHPLEGVVWLANMLGSLGQTLEAGSVIMAGSITAAVAIFPGDVVTASFGELGTVTTEFAE